MRNSALILVRVEFFAKIYEFFRLKAEFFV